MAEFVTAVSLLLLVLLVGSVFVFVLCVGCSLVGHRRFRSRHREVE